MKTATRLKSPKLKDFKGDARLYKLEPPLDGHQYVIVSATVVPYTGPETYVFASDAKGEITEWNELDGSFRGGLDHAKALKGAGYTIKEPNASV